MVKADSLLEPALDIGTVGARESHFLDGLVYCLLFFAGAQVEAHEVLRVGGGRCLRKVNDVDGRLALVHEFLHFGRKLRGAVGEVERDGALRRTDCNRFAPGVLRHLAFEKFRRADGRAHQQESGLRKREERNLPGDTALAVGVVVELVHHDVGNRELFAFAERHVA